MIIDGKHRDILDVSQRKGSVHGFTMYKETVGRAVTLSIRIEADLGYLGMEKFHENSRIPKKASKFHKLTEREKTFNRKLARSRIVIEHINAKIKTFKIMDCLYRNHRQRHLLKISLICDIINFELNSKIYCY